MAGPLTIQRYPRGLLDALQMRGTGDAPHALSELLVGTFDTTQLYLADKLINAQHVNMGVASGFTASNIVVPSGEIWLGVFAGAILNSGVGVTGNCTLMIRRTPIGLAALPLGQGMPFVASQVTPIPAPQFAGLIMLPGDAIGNYGWQIAGAPTLTLSADYYRLTF